MALGRGEFEGIGGGAVSGDGGESTTEARRHGEEEKRGEI